MMRVLEGAVIAVGDTRCVDMFAIATHWHRVSTAVRARVLRAHQGGRHHAPDGKHDCQQHQQQDAKSFHGGGG